MFLSLFCFENINAQTYEELKKMQDEYKKALDRQSLKKSTEIINAEEKASIDASLPDMLLYSKNDVESIITNTKELLTRIKVLEDSVNKMPFIGYDLFSARDTIPFWQNLPIPQNYILGPGDQIIISLWGEIDLVNEIFVNRDGQFYVENIGMINVAGMSINEAKKYILSRYSKVYSTLRGSNPKSFLDISLGKLKSINVHFVGHVNVPGVHMIHPFSNIVMGLNQAGGVNLRGSLRYLQVIRNNKILKELDLYDYLFKGTSLNDIRLLDQDIVLVKPRYSTIPINGSIIRSGYYEARAEETLGDLIRVAGGKDRSSNENIYVYRNTNSPVEGDYILNFKEIGDFKIINGDSVHIPKMSISDKFVEISGQIKNPGKYPFEKNMTLKDLLNIESSLKDTEFLKTMNLNNTRIYRKNPNDMLPLVLSLTNYDENYKIFNGDHINIPPSNKLGPIVSIIVTGEVKKPGTIPINSSTTLSDVIKLSGGVTEHALGTGIEIFRDTLKIAWENKNFIVAESDSINFLRKTGLVKIEGEVNSPGYISYNKRYNLKDYINKAGGYTAFAENKNILIVYPNGIAIPNKRLRSPKVFEGSTIIVNQRTLSGYMGKNNNTSFSTIANQAGNFTSSILSLLLIMNQLNGS